MTCRPIILLALFLLPSVAAAQDGCVYFSHKYKAVVFAENEQPGNSILEYRRAFAIHTHDLADLLNAAHLALKYDSLDAATSFLNAALECGLAWEDLPLAIKIPACDARITDFDRWYAHFHPLPPNADVELIARIRRMAERDQSVRDLEVEVEDNVMWAADSLNALELRAIVAEMGRLPGYSDLGWEGLDDLDLLFHHMQFKDLQFFTPYVIAGIRTGEYTDNTTIAYQIDRIAVSEGRALYIDEEDQLRELPTPQTPLVGRAYWSVTGEWDDFLPSGESVLWPIWPALGEAGANKTRQRLCLDPVSGVVSRKPWLRQASATAVRTAFGIKD